MKMHPFIVIILFYLQCKVIHDIFCPLVMKRGVNIRHMQFQAIVLNSMHTLQEVLNFYFQLILKYGPFLKVNIDLSM